jgi:hypothetical protein
MNGSREVLRRVLGQTGPDAGCDRSGDLLDQLVEAERAGRPTTDALRAVYTHLQGCPDCHEDYLGLHALAEAMSGEAGTSQPG